LILRTLHESQARRASRARETLGRVGMIGPESVQTAGRRRRDEEAAGWKHQWVGEGGMSSGYLSGEMEMEMEMSGILWGKNLVVMVSLVNDSGGLYGLAFRGGRRRSWGRCPEYGVTVWIRGKYRDAY
jgi:hypothetical protein